MSYLRLPAVTANDFASTPSVASLNITGRIWLAADIAADDWTPAAADALVSKFTVLFNLKGYALQILTTGRLRATYSPDGATDRTFDSTVNPGGVNGERLAVGVDMDPDNGSDQRTATFYTGPELGGPWTPLGGVVTQAGADPAIAVTSASLIVGALVVINPGNHFAGRVFGAEVRDGGIAGTVVARPVFEAQYPGKDFHDSTGKLWTLSGGAQVEGVPVEAFRHTDGRFVHEVDAFDHDDARFEHVDPRFAYVA